LSIHVVAPGICLLERRRFVDGGGGAYRSVRKIGQPISVRHCVSFGVS
jgi:hypothetical protein